MKIFKKFILICSMLMIAFGAYVIYDINQAPKTINEKTLRLKANSLDIFDDSNKLVYHNQDFNQDYIKYNEIPKLYQNALISTEDKNFWNDHGVSPKDTAKAVIETLIHGGTAGVGGGSTITQQLVKLSVFSTALKDRTIKRKIQDIWISYQLSYKIPKQKILEYYVNRIYEGQNMYGAQTISEFYYNKPLKDLNLSQTAYIAGIGQAPAIYDLYKNPKKCEQRRNIVLLSMLNNHKITKQQYEDTKKVPITYGLIPKEQAIEIQNQKNYPDYIKNKSYIMSVIQQLQDNNINIKNNNIKVYSNLNEHAQNVAYDTLNNNNMFDNPEMHNKQAAMTLENPSNGEIIAQIGGRNIDGKPNNINRAVETNRSSGSTIKPILDYAPAIEYLGWGTNHMVEDVPYDYKGTHLEVHDWDNKYEGKISMAKALIESRNVPAIRTLEQVGIDKATRFMNQFGIQTTSKLTPANAIGVDTSTCDLAGAYSAFATLGMYHKQSYINRVSINNDIVHHYNDYEGNMIMTDSTAYIINKILEQAISSNDGCAHAANIDGLTQAGKSGTVSYDVSNQNPNDVTDLWMCGYTPSVKEQGLSCSVWVGADKPNGPDGKIPQAYQSIAQVLYKDIMSSLANKNPDWPMPDDVKHNGNDYAPLNQAQQSDESSQNEQSSDYNSTSQSSESSQSNEQSNGNPFSSESSSYNPDIPSQEDQVNAVGANNIH